MVKRITAVIFALLLLSVSILGQIDYNKQIKNGPSVSQGNMNNIRIVDGLKFAQTAAGINAADSDLGAAAGEIWVPSVPSGTITATDAQISISARHTLKVFGALVIEAASPKGPILLNGNGAGLLCTENPSANIQENTGLANITSMVRLGVQDGSQVGNFVQGCDFYANSASVTNGIIDATGITQIGWIRDNRIHNFGSGWGIFIQDIQSGVLGGTTNVQISNNQISASTTAGCIEITHSSTNAALLYGFDIQDINCSSGTSITTAPILITNTSAGNNIREVNITNAVITSVPGGQPGITINGVYQAAAKHIVCYSPGSGSAGCVNIPTNAQTANITTDNITTFPASNSNTVVDTNNGATVGGLTLGKYDPNFNVILKQTTSNFNNIRIVDGIKFTQNAAGINAADVDLGVNTYGEIWVPNAGQINASDAQISIGANHVLKIFGSIRIEANNTKGPILLGNNAGLACTNDNAAVNIVENNASQTIASMVRATTNDGSQNGNFVVGCDFFGNTASVTNGIIDFTGFVRGWIRDNQAQSFSSGWALFAQDIQSGALGGTSHVQIMNNRLLATGTAGCIEITHSATNAVSINHLQIQDITCNPGPTAPNPGIFFQNLAPNAALFGHFDLMNVDISSNFTASAVQLAGGQSVMVKNVWCNVGAACVTITNTVNNLGQSFENLWSFGGNTLVDLINSVTLATQIVGHYDIANNGAQYAGYYPNVSYLKVNGLSPTIAVTGFGTGPSISLNPGSTNNAGIIQGTTGTAPGSSGTFTLTFNTTQTAFGANFPACVVTLSGAWNARATLFINSTTNVQAVFGWDNNGVNLAASTSSFNAHYWCSAR